jgi:hypothetical protein
MRRMGKGRERNQTVKPPFLPHILLIICIDRVGVGTSSDRRVCCSSSGYQVRPAFILISFFCFLPLSYFFLFSLFFAFALCSLLFVLSLLLIFLFSLIDFSPFFACFSLSFLFFLFVIFCFFLFSIF